MKRFSIFALLFVLLLSACGTPTPTQTTSPPTETPIVVTVISPPPTPTIESPLPTPEDSENRAPSAGVEKPQTMEENQMFNTSNLSLPDMLAAIATGGSVLGVIISFLFEQFSWFQALTGKARFWTIGALSIGLPVAATALILYVPASVWDALKPFWMAAFAGGTTWLSSQLAHRLNTGKIK